VRSYKHKLIMFYVIVGCLLLSNIFFYSKFVTIQRDVNYMTNIANKINLAKTIKSIDPIKTLISDRDKDLFMPLLEEMAVKGGDAYSLENYVVLKYNNGNTLLVQTAQNEEGNFFIQDIFFLDEQSYDKLIWSADDEQSVQF